MEKKSNLNLDHNEFQLIIIPTILTPLLILLIITLYLIDFGSKPISFEGLICSCLALILLFINSYALKIGVKDKVLYASVGIGLIKKTINIKDIISVESIKVPWYAGIGVRYYNRGILFNAKAGMGIKIIYDETKTLIIVPKDINRFYALFSHYGLEKLSKFKNSN